MAFEERAHQEKVRLKAAGAASAKAVLGHLSQIRAVFDEQKDPWNTPEQDSYRSDYRAAVLAAVDIDNDAVAKTLTEIAEVYSAAWLANDLDEWTTYSLNKAVYELAHGTVRAYTQDEELPDRHELDRMLREIEGNWEQRQENEKRAREEELKERSAEPNFTPARRGPP